MRLGETIAEENGARLVACSDGHFHGMRAVGGWDWGTTHDLARRFDCGTDPEKATEIFRRWANEPTTHTKPDRH